MLRFDPRLILLVASGILVVVAVLLKEERVKRIAIGSIIGWFAAMSFVEPLMLLVSKQKFVTVTQAVLQLVVFGAITILVGFSVISRDKTGPDKVGLRSILLMVATLGFIALAVLTFLPVELRERLVTDYNLVALMYGVRIWWMMATVGVLIGLTLWPRAKKHA